MPKQPNVVIILTDDQGYGDIGRHGNEQVITPNIDALWEESVRLADFHAAPSCAPARAGFLTGQYCDKTNVWHTVGGRSILRKDVPTMGSIFHEAGYRTACIGKWHLGDNYPYRAQDKGFDEVLIHRGGGIGQAPDYWGNDYFANTFDHLGEPVRYDGYCTDVFFRESMRFIAEEPDKPFLLYLAPNAPHYPLRVEDRYYNLYKGKMPDDRAKCYGMLTNIDDNLGILRDFLRAQGLERNTILVYATDNGGEFGFTLDSDQFVTEGYNAGMRGRKCSAYEGGHRVPCFLYYPDGGLDRPRDVGSCTCNMDLLPTLMDYCGVSSPCSRDFDGESLRPLLEGQVSEAEFDRRKLVVDSQRIAHPMKWKTSCVMKGRWRLIDGKELYHLAEDPEQRRDLAEERPDILEELRGFYEEWWERVSLRFDEEIPIGIGSVKENPVFLSSHDWRGSEPDCVWNQGEIRRGLYHNSYWEIEVLADGWYTIELRRWPRELDLEIAGGIDGEAPADWREWYSGGRALPIVGSALEVQGQRYEQPVSPRDRYVRYRVRLRRGTTHLQSYFYDRDAKSLGAYYVYVACESPVD